MSIWIWWKRIRTRIKVRTNRRCNSC